MAALDENSCPSDIQDESKISLPLCYATPQYTISHPLLHNWVLWFDCPAPTSTHLTWEERLKEVYAINTVEKFWSVFNNVISVDSLGPGCNYSFFKEGIKPAWEDHANANGGAWTLNTLALKHKTLGELWQCTLLGLLGGQFDGNLDEITGATVSVKIRYGNKISIWTRHTEKAAEIKEIGSLFKAALEVPPPTMLDFQAHKKTESSKSRGYVKVDSLYTV